MNRRRLNVEDIQNEQFYQLHKFLFNEEFKELSNDARVLYSLLRERHDLSIQNNWVDEYGNVYLIFSRGNMAEMLGCSIPTARKAFKNLQEFNLVEEERQGQGKPNIIFLNVVSVKSEKTFHSRQKEVCGQDRKNLSPNNTNINNTNKKIICAFFENLWKLYPNKKGKGKISDTQKQKLYKIGQEHLERAISRYLKDLERDKWRKPQNGSTFFNSGYIDYLDENYEEQNEFEEGLPYYD